MTVSPAQRSRRPSIGPRGEVYFVGSAVFHYLGPSFAVLLFARVDVLGVAWLRIATAGAVFAIWRRPWRRLAGMGWRDLWLFIFLGVVLAVMNSVFYLAIDRLPLATVAAIEFVGPILLAAIGARSRRNVLALCLAVPGVYVLTGVHFGSDRAGVLFALANAALFTAYIVLSHRIARHETLGGIDGLAFAMLVATVVAVPIGLREAAPALLQPVALTAAIGVGITSSVIPYVCDQLAMARLPRATYALMIALLPATATVVGAIVLAQIPSLVELAGIGLVVLGVAAHAAPEAEPG